MKKRLAFIIAWVLALTLGTGAALAETSYAGQVAPGETVHIQAPFAASVEQVSAETGDFVHAGDALFALSHHQNLRALRRDGSGRAGAGRRPSGRYGAFL